MILVFWSKIPVDRLFPVRCVVRGDRLSCWNAAARWVRQLVSGPLQDSSVTALLVLVSLLASVFVVYVKKLEPLERRELRWMRNVVRKGIWLKENELRLFIWVVVQRAGCSLLVPCCLQHPHHERRVSQLVYRCIRIWICIYFSKPIEISFRNFMSMLMWGAYVNLQQSIPITISMPSVEHPCQILSKISHTPYLKNFER